MKSRKKSNQRRIKGAEDRPRLSVFRSNKAIYAQIINDESGKTLVSASNSDFNQNQKQADVKGKRALLIGEVLAEKALKKGIKKVVFDRGRYPYHGRVKALATGARKGGLDF